MLWRNLKYSDHCKGEVYLFAFTVEGSLEIVTPHFVSSTYAFFFFAVPMDCPKLAPNEREVTTYHRTVTGGTPVPPVPCNFRRGL